MADYYYSYSRFLKEKFGGSVRKISLATKSTCPNRDGQLGEGGCIYCSDTGSGRVSKEPPFEQARNYLLSRRDEKCGYIAYFQSFSNMYKSGGELLPEIERIAKLDGIVGFSVATRPDALDDSILKRLASMSGEFFIQVELGLESSNDITLERINRKAKADDFMKAAERVRRAVPSSHIVCHVIIGLPGETERDFERTVKFFSESLSDGIKFHHLYVIRGTKLDEMFKQRSAVLMSEEEYISILLKLLSLVPADRVIHRMKSSCRARELVSPLWTLDAKFHEKVYREAERLGIYQGSAYGDNDFNCW